MVTMRSLLAIDTSLRRLRWQLAATRFSLKLRRFATATKAGFNPDQLRDDYGRWSDGGGLSSRTGRFRSRVTDVSAARRFRPKGHHYADRQLQKQSPEMSTEVRKVFENSTTGKLLDRRSNKFDTPHRVYNDTVKDLFKGFLDKNGIDKKAKGMTAEQARSFLKEILESRDPRIRRFNMLILLREIMHHVPRWPRGNE